MGIVEETLAKFELDSGEECYIEKNIDGVIHLHIGMFRIDMTQEEFEHFGETILDAHESLGEVKGWD